VIVRRRRPRRGDSLSIDLESDFIGVGIHYDGLSLAQILLAPIMRQDERHRLLCEIGLPKIVDKFGEAVLVGPALRIHVQQRRVDVVSVGAMVSIEPDYYVPLGQLFVTYVGLVLPQLRSGDLAARSVPRFGAELVVVKRVPAADGAAQQIFDRQIFISELHVTTAVFSAPQIDDATGIFRACPSRIGWLVSLVAHRPDEDARMIAIGTDGFDEHHALDVAAKLDVLDVWQLFDGDDTEPVGKIVDARIIRGSGPYAGSTFPGSVAYLTCQIVGST